MSTSEEIKKLNDRISKLEKQLLEKEELIEEFLDRMSKAFEQVVKLEKIVKDQQTIIAAFQGKNRENKTSRNSNFPPSKDKFRLNRRHSNRTKSGKKSGGQKGHKGTTLEFSNSPDETVDCYPEQCDRCGKQLSKKTAQFYAARQVIDIPPIETLVYQYNTYQIACSCGCKTSADFPTGLNASVQYGAGVRSLISYLSVRQYLPYARLCELLKDVFHISMSQGSIANSLKRTAENGSDLYESIHHQVEQAKVVGSDETWIYVNGKKKVLWTWQSKDFTYLRVFPSRHKRHIQTVFPNGFQDSILVSDQYAAQLSTPAKGHQICWPHILRKIKGLQELQDSIWLKRLLGVIHQAYELYYEKGYFKRISKRVRGLIEDLNTLLLRKIHHKTHPEIKKLQLSLRRDRPYLLTFLFHKEVPPDNNASEAAIRNAKVKVKISGGFKSLEQQYAIIRSIIDTAIKQGRNVLHTLHLVELQKINSF